MPIDDASAYAFYVFFFDAANVASTLLSVSSLVFVHVHVVFGSGECFVRVCKHINR